MRLPVLVPIDGWNGELREWIQERLLTQTA